MSVKHLDEVYEELFLYGLVRRETLEKHTGLLHPYLREKASQGELVSYEKAKGHVDTSRQYLGRVLGAINECEHRKGNPLLTAIVVRDEKIDGERHPSRGFFSWPCIQDREPDVWVHPDKKGSLSADQLAFWEEERDWVWEHWADG